MKLTTILLLVCSRPANGQLPNIEMLALSQCGGQVGTEIDVRVVSGKFLDEIERLQFTHPGITANVVTDDPLPFSQDRIPRYGAFRVAIAKDVKPGRYEVRALGRHGLSNPRPFLVTTLPSAVLETVSHDVSKPTPLIRGTIHHAHSTPEQIDYYSIHLEAGESIQVDLVAQRLDSRMIGKLTVMEAPNRTLQSVRGTDYVDPQLTLNATHAGDYILTVHDFLYGGGNEYFYQLCVQTKASAIDILGTQPSAGELPLHSLPESFSLLNQPELVAVQGDEAQSLQTITPPCQVSATFDGRDDEDAYQFNATAGDLLAIELQSQRREQPTDGRVEIEHAEPQPSGDPIWKSVLSQDDSQDIGDAGVNIFTRDPAFNFQVPSTGAYRLLIRDLDNGTSLSQNQAYRMLVHPPAPDFALLAYFPTTTNDPSKSNPSGIRLFREGTQSIKVLLVRRDGWTGPVDVRVEGLPENVTCRNTTIAANQNQVNLTLYANERAAEWLGPIRVIGTATTDPAKPAVMHDAIPASITWGRDGIRDFARSRLSSGLVVAVSARDAMPLSIGFGDEAIVKVKKGESIMVPVKLVRRDGGKQPCVLRPRDLPPGVTAAEITIAADADTGQVELKVAADAMPTIYSIWLQAETKVKLKQNPESLLRAEQYRAQLAKLLDEPDQASQKDAINAAIKIADQRVEASKPAAQEQELNIFVASPTVSIEIVNP